MDNIILDSINTVIKRTAKGLVMLRDANVIKEVCFKNGRLILCIKSDLFKRLGLTEIDKVQDFADYYYSGFDFEGCFIAAGDSRKVATLEAEDEAAE